MKEIDLKKRACRHSEMFTRVKVKGNTNQMLQMIVHCTRTDTLPTVFLSTTTIDARNDNQCTSTVLLPLAVSCSSWWSLLHKIINCWKVLIYHDYAIYYSVSAACSHRSICFQHLLDQKCDTFSQTLNIQIITGKFVAVQHSPQFNVASNWVICSLNLNCRQ